MGQRESVREGEEDGIMQLGLVVEMVGGGKLVTRIERVQLTRELRSLVGVPPTWP